MPDRANFVNFGIVLAAICIPFFSIIGFLSTKYGYSIWAQKTKELWRFIRPKNNKKEKLPDDENVPPRTPVHRSLTTEEAMRARLGQNHHIRARRLSQRPQPSHPNIQRMVQRMGEGRESGLKRMGTLADEKSSEDVDKVKSGAKSTDTVIEIQG